MPILNISQPGISEIGIKGYKSLLDGANIEIRPLTILAGANSSGKSSIMQPLLLMKQTLEAEYDPGVFLLNGPNVQLTQLDQMFSSVESDEQDKITVRVKLTNTESLTTEYLRTGGKQISISEAIYQEGDDKEGYTTRVLRPDMSLDEILDYLDPNLDELRRATERLTRSQYDWGVVPSRCFLNIGLVENTEADRKSYIDWGGLPSMQGWRLGEFITNIIKLIHVPGLRGNPKRTYPATHVAGREFEGTFEHYTAGVINQWKTASDTPHLKTLTEMLRKLGLASTIDISHIDDASLEIRIGRTLNSNLDDTVSIADVGFGVSQILPVLVALLVAEYNQLVYLEQPELHLHPRAHVALAEVLADAAKRGARVVAETHSSLLLMSIQTLIAQGKLPPNRVILHWFTRDDEGKTHIDSIEPDENGAYGDWPEDFDDVTLSAQKRYLDAVATREFGS